VIKVIEKEKEDEVDEIRVEQEENKRIQILKRNNGFIIKLKRKDLTHIIYFTKKDFLKLCNEIQKFI
jgi:hypothetical protein